MQDSPRGPISPDLSIKHLDRFIKQIAAIGFEGIDIIGVLCIPEYLNIMFGSPKKFLEFIKERGIEKVVSGWIAYAWMDADHAPHIRSTHDKIYQDCEKFCKFLSSLEAEYMVTMPSNTYWQVEPVTDEKIKNMADCYNRVGKMTMNYGIRMACHHEFWCAIRTVKQLDKFYKWTDPEYVYYWLDTAQTVIAGNDPVDLYLRFHDRCAGFHFKDTHHIDTKRDYRLPPDPELMASTTKRWFWEMGTLGGLVDFPELMKAIREYNFRGWITVEHDKAYWGGPDLRGNYAESTCIAKWYIDNVLSKIYE